MFLRKCKQGGFENKTMYSADYSFSYTLNAYALIYLVHVHHNLPLLYPKKSSKELVFFLLSGIGV